MRVLDAGRAFQLAWDVLGHLPGGLVRGMFDVAGVAAWALHGSGVRRLEANYARVRPEMSPREVRRLSRAGMRAYMRYYAEVFTLRAMTPEQLEARVRLVDEENVFGPRAEGRSVVAALAHMGNWDLAGAYSGSHIMPVVTVAERLEPPRLYEEFLEFRQSLGMTIHTLGDDGVFGRLLRATQAGGSLVPLLADRDLTARGLEVDMFGRRARVAAGPAALAVATGAPLLPIAMWHERLTGERRRRAGTPWGLVIQFHPAVEVDAELPRRERTLAMTQAWVDALASSIAERPEQWHMLQRVFVEDLDPERYARTTAAAASTEADAAETQEER
ncbi:KDO2-lipid IV(A) lauroyltransferase [Flavimobilis soli]|uniref:KDO2-lipid IV(A) lauroyltransferase n=1 Tax=Flavimobilis soli TaxID=442709 RepID=A0A2A9EA40_9MICO|nr:phosphatidylinositol mannoside acyltransferase [Flavimobilis soli]PFG35683.1 KDO2-lipid IV(A) lauroyltransferase [Flavimobilis soli]